MTICGIKRHDTLFFVLQGWIQTHRLTNFTSMVTLPIFCKNLRVKNNEFHIGNSNRYIYVKKFFRMSICAIYGMKLFLTSLQIDSHYGIMVICYKKGGVMRTSIEELLPVERELSILLDGTSRSKCFVFTDDPYWISRFDKTCVASKTTNIGAKHYETDIQTVLIILQKGQRKNGKAKDSSSSKV